MLSKFMTKLGKKCDCHELQSQFGRTDLKAKLLGPSDPPVNKPKQFVLPPPSTRNGTGPDSPRKYEFKVGRD